MVRVGVSSSVKSDTRVFLGSAGWRIQEGRKEKKQKKMKKRRISNSEEVVTDDINHQTGTPLGKIREEREGKRGRERRESGRPRDGKTRRIKMRWGGGGRGGKRGEGWRGREEGEKKRKKKREKRKRKRRAESSNRQMVVVRETFVGRPNGFSSGAPSAETVRST
ncbi:hypothetical protein BDV59DRAFT_57219 [Aspergillus ambiguus]|uniref:uncharacterized protein n=1 Tax=Aspergillus ambiguus TaxID=176160 RepID=UPI003CCE1E73